jgi:two-component system, NarL family, response regulator
MGTGNALPDRRHASEKHWQAQECIRVVIADDHAVVREGFHAVCDDAGFVVAGLPRSSPELLEILQGSSFDVLLLDTRMPGGADALHTIRGRGSRPRVVALSSLEPDEQVCAAVEHGATGFLLKDSSRQQIVETIRTVHSGKPSLPLWVLVRISERKNRPGLSRRELEVLEMVSKGLTNKEIAHAIQVSHFTVRNHVRRIIDKLDVGDRTEAATMAIQQGILSSYC